LKGERSVERGRVKSLNQREEERRKEKKERKKGRREGSH
jgi:hypothetical protein